MQITPQRSTSLLRPQAVQGISAWQVFPGTYVVGNCDLDRYIAVPAAKLSIVREVLSCFDGSHTIADITERFSSQGQKLDIPVFYQRLFQAGLLVGSEPRGELGRLALPLFDMGVASAFRASRAVIRFLLVPVLLASAATVVAGLLSWIMSPVPALTDAARDPHSWTALTFTVFALAMMLSLLLHEMAHGVTATWLGLIPSRFVAVAYLGLIPIFFLKIPGMYTLPPKARIHIWIAGVWANLTIASTAWFVVQITKLPVFDEKILRQVALANILIVGLNLLPFLPTDGYFIMSTLLKKPNIRPKAWQEFSRWIRLRTKPSPMLLLYFGLSVLATLATLMLNVAWIYHIATRSVVGCVLGCLLSLPVFLGFARLTMSLIATKKSEEERI